MNPSKCMCLQPHCTHWGHWCSCVTISALQNTTLNQHEQSHSLFSFPKSWIECQGYATVHLNPPETVFRWRAPQPVTCNFQTQKGVWYLQSSRVGFSVFLTPLPARGKPQICGRDITGRRTAWHCHFTYSIHMALLFVKPKPLVPGELSPTLPCLSALFVPPHPDPALPQTPVFPYQLRSGPWLTFPGSVMNCSLCTENRGAGS